MLFRERADACIAALFLIAIGEEDDIAVQTQAGALQCNEGSQVSDERAFVVDGAAAP